MKKNYTTGEITYEKYDIVYVATADALVAPRVRIEQAVIMESGHCLDVEEEDKRVVIKLNGTLYEVAVAELGADPDYIRQGIIDLLS